MYILGRERTLGESREGITRHNIQPAQHSPAEMSPPFGAEQYRGERSSPNM